MKSRFSRNDIIGLKVGEILTQDVKGIKQLALNHFQERFHEPFSTRLNLVGVPFNELSRDDKNALELPFSLQDIKNVIWNGTIRKIPSPSGFSMKFYKARWSIIKFDLLECINDFFLQTYLSKSMVLSFISLIPKNHNPQILNDYHPICLIGSIYRIISKLLVDRLKRLLTNSFLRTG